MNMHVKQIRRFLIVFAILFSVVNVRTFAAESAEVTANYAYVVFDGNGADSGSMETIDREVTDSAETLPANAYKRKGYSFIGWNTAADGSGDSYANKANLSAFVRETRTKVTLYAVWELKTYTVQYMNLRPTDKNSQNPQTYTTLTETITLAPAVRKGYTFVNWYKNSSMTRPVTEIKQGSTGNLTFYAKWQVNEYTIKFYGNGATSGEMTNLSCEYDSTYVLPANAFQRKGYSFVGWNTKADGSGKSYKDMASVQGLTTKSGGTVKMYAVWKANIYYVRFHANGGSGSMSKITCKYGNTYTLPSNKFTQTSEYRFAGWNTKKDGSGKLYKNKAEIKNLTSVNKRSITLYAQWELKKPVATLEKLSYSANKITISGVTAEGYEIYRSKKADGVYQKVGITTTLSFVDKKVAAGAKYYYKVKAYVIKNGEKVYSVYSSAKSITTAQMPQFSGYLETKVGKTSSFCYIHINNRGSLDLYAGGASNKNFVLVYPYDGAKYSIGYYGTGRATSVKFSPNSAAYTQVYIPSASPRFDAGAYCTFYMKYDGCMYLVNLHDDGECDFKPERTE